MPDMSTLRTSAIRISRSAIADIVSEATASVDGRETGGILLGRSQIDGVVVRHAGGPGPGASRTPDTFHRDLEFARALAADVWNRDGSQWVGEWHTHPSRNYSPSARDLSSYRAHLADDELGFTEFICLIVGVPSRTGTPVAGWIVTLNGLHKAPVIVLG
jgi:integrative and conjugative element protein (TIGR02256 family)